MRVRTPQPTDVLRPSVNPVAECRPRNVQTIPIPNPDERPRPTQRRGQRRGGGMPPTLSGIHSDPRTGPAASTYFGVIVNIPAIYWLASGPWTRTGCKALTDESRIVGAVAPVSFAQKGRCWQMISANPVGQATV